MLNVTHQLWGLTMKILLSFIVRAKTNPTEFLEALMSFGLSGKQAIAATGKLNPQCKKTMDSKAPLTFTLLINEKQYTYTKLIGAEERNNKVVIAFRCEPHKDNVFDATQELL